MNCLFVCVHNCQRHIFDDPKKNKINKNRFTNNKNVNLINQMINRLSILLYSKRVMIKTPEIHLWD